MATYVNDTFTEGGNVALESHAPDVGGAWVEHSASGGGAVVDAANGRVTGGSPSATSIYYNDADPASANYDVTAVVRWSGSNAFPGVLARVDPAAATYYQFYVNAGGFELVKRVAGSVTVLRSVGRTISLDTPYKLTIRVRDDQISGFVDDDLVASVKDTSISAAGKAGLICRSTGSVDDFDVEDIGLRGNIIGVEGIWTEWTDPRAIYHNGSYYIGAARGDGDVEIGQYVVATGDFKWFILASELETDDHDNPGIVVLPSGKIAAFYSKHNDTTSRYRVTTNAGDISAWDAEVQLASIGGGQTANLSYSNPFYLPGPDKVFFFYIATTQLARKLALRIANNDLSSWGEEILIAESESAGDDAYFKFIANAPNRIDCLCTNRHPVNDGPSHVYHFYMAWDAGSSALKYYKSDGTEITATKPWKVHEQATKIYDGTAVKGWVGDIRIGSDGHPRVLFNTYPDAGTDHRYNFSRWDPTANDNAGGWTTPVEVAAAGGPLYAVETYYSGLFSFDGNDPNVAYLSIDVGGGVYEIQEWRTEDDGETWSKVRDITTGSNSTLKNARPYSPSGHDGTFACLWWRANYSTYTSFHTTSVHGVANDTGIAPPSEAPIPAIMQHYRRRRAA